MSVDRPEAAKEEQAGGNGHEDPTASEITDEVTARATDAVDAVAATDPVTSTDAVGDRAVRREPSDRTEPFDRAEPVEASKSSPGFPEGRPIVVSPPTPPPVLPPPALPPYGPAGPAAAPPFGPAGPVDAPADDRPLYDRPQRARRRRAGTEAPEGRWVTHRLRHLSLWSVLKLASLFYICLFFSLLVATVLLWNVGRSTGAIDQVESFISSMGSYGECVPEEGLDPGTEFDRDEDCKDGNVRVGMFELDGTVVFRSALIGGLVFVVAATVGTVLMTVLFNLLNEITGGLRYTLIREPTAAGSGPPAPRGRPPGMRRRV